MHRRHLSKWRAPIYIFLENCIHIHTHHIHPPTHLPSVSLPIQAKDLPLPQAQRLGDHLGPRPTLAHHERGRLACVCVVDWVLIIVRGGASAADLFGLVLVFECWILFGSNLHTTSEGRLVCVCVLFGFGFLRWWWWWLLLWWWLCGSIRRRRGAARLFDCCLFVGLLCG